MSEFRLSPTAANNRARKAMRTRMRLLRLGERPVDSQRVFADRIVSLLQAAAGDNPGEWSDAYSEHVLTRYSDRYAELARSTGGAS